MIFNAVSYRGRMMGIPGPSAGLDSYSYFWVRQDWLYNLGLAPPRTTEELLEMARAFTHDDPDGNGQDDTFAMMLDKGLWYRSEGFFWSFGAYPDAWLEAPGGGLMYGALQPEVKDALAALRHMHADGQLDPEWAVKDGSQGQRGVRAQRRGHLLRRPLDLLRLPARLGERQQHRTGACTRSREWTARPRRASWSWACSASTRCARGMSTPRRC